MFSYYVMSKLSSGHPHRPSRTRRDQALMFPLWLSRGRFSEGSAQMWSRPLPPARNSSYPVSFQQPPCPIAGRGQLRVPSVSTSGPGVWRGSGRQRQLVCRFRRHPRRRHRLSRRHHHRPRHRHPRRHHRCHCRAVLKTRSNSGPASTAIRSESSCTSLQASSRSMTPLRSKTLQPRDL